MAVATVPKGSRTIRNANRIQNTLASPYAFNTHWVKLTNNDESEILMSLERLFMDLPPFASVKHPAQRSNSETTTREDGQNAVVKALRSLIVVGINQVTKCLERGQLEAVVLNKPNPSEAVLTEHLKVLSATRSTPVCVLPSLKERLRKPMNINSVSVIGFKKTTQCPASLPYAKYQSIRILVQRIQEATSCVVLPWLHTEDELAEKVEELKGRMFPNGGTRITSEYIPGVKREENRRSAKRKLEETSEPTKKSKVEDGVLASPFASEELKVLKEDGNVTRTIKKSIKYQTANIMHILKGNKKKGKAGKKDSKK